MSQWAEIRYLHLTEGVALREIARRFGLDVKTVRRAVSRDVPPAKWKEGRACRPRGLAAHRDAIVALLKGDSRLTAKRIGRMLEASGLVAGPLSERTVREYVAELRRELFPPEAFVHRTHAPGETMEADFGHAWASLGGQRLRLPYLVVTLPASNAYFAKAYRVERMECLFDGLLSAFRYFGGLPKRVVLDNSSLVVRRIEKGRDRLETQAFRGFHGCFPFSAEYCAPGKGNEKGSVEGGVKYVRNNCFRPLPEADSMAALNATILDELETDLSRRRHPDGETCAAALASEREALRPLRAHLPEPCVTTTRVADKFGHVRLDSATYSVPSQYARQALTVKVFAESVRIASGDEVIAEHARLFEKGAMSLPMDHVLDTLERKSRAASEATAIRQANLPAVFETLRAALHERTRHADREWVRVLRLQRQHTLDVLEGVVEAALEMGSPRLATIEMLLRQRTQGLTLLPSAVPLTDREDLASLTVREADLDAYGTLGDDVAPNDGEVA